jgi:hypothetical protein
LGSIIIATIELGAAAIKYFHSLQGSVRFIFSHAATVLAAVMSVVILDILFLIFITSILALGTLPEDGNVMPKHAGATICNKGLFNPVILGIFNVIWGNI